MGTAFTNFDQVDLSLLLRPGDQGEPPLQEHTHQQDHSFGEETERVPGSSKGGVLYYHLGYRTREDRNSVKTLKSFCSGVLKI